MRRVFLSFLFVVIAFSSVFAATTAIQNPYGRSYVSLNGEWTCFADLQQTGLYNFHGQLEKMPYFCDRSPQDDRTKLVEYDFDAAGKIAVPGDWNTQNARLYYYEGPMWYRTRFDCKKVPGKRYFLYVGAANYKSITALNAHILGEHKGGFTPFSYEVTDCLRNGSNSLVMNIDNTRGASEVPTVRFDWWNYGGITRDVMLVELPSVFIKDYSVLLDGGNTRAIRVCAELDGAKEGVEVTVSIPELKVRKKVSTDENGRVSFVVKAKPELWCPENPKLYDVTLSAAEDVVSDRIGFRTIAVDGTRILLNGKSVFLKGVAVHEETLGANPGRVTTKKEAEELVAVAKSMGCNFLRLAHYPHNELMVRAAEEAGLMVWDEIPCYWAIDWTNADTYANAENQLVEMISRDHNRANVIIWSVANETPKGEARLAFLVNLIRKARSMDGSRLVCAALLTNYIDRATSRITVDDDLADYTDLLCFNEYVGWYDGGPEHCAEMKWEFPVQKPVVITEFGGGAKYGMDGDAGYRFTEQHLECIYKAQTEMFKSMENLAGTCPWVLKDFRSPRRMLAGVQDEFNRKGLVDEKGNRKKAFFIMQKYYSTK